MPFDSPNDLVVPAPLPQVIRVSWSKPRCWHGDKVTIRVRTERVKDGDNVLLSVSAQGAPNHFDQITPGPQIANDAVDHDYMLDWQTKLNPPYPTQVVVSATITALNITAQSDPMDVDLIPPLHSA